MLPLPLDDSRWSELTHAYGSAEDIPALLRKLREPGLSWGWDDEPMFSLWSSLCHQGDVYTASYAAVPHLLRAMNSAPSEGKPTLLGLAASILALSEAERTPIVDAQTSAQFQEDRRRLGELASALLTNLESDSDESTLVLLLGAVAVSKGHARLGNFLLQAHEEWECHECGAPLPGYNLEH